MKHIATGALVNKEENENRQPNVERLVACYDMSISQLVSYEKSSKLPSHHQSKQGKGTLFSNSYRCNLDVRNSHRISYIILTIIIKTSS